jgi:hypothetical protein
MRCTTVSARTSRAPGRTSAAGREVLATFDSPGRALALALALALAFLFRAAIRLDAKLSLKASTSF